MIQREVTKTKKDKDGDILALCNPGKYWSPKSKKDAISEINSKTINYYVIVDGKRVDIHVVEDDGDEYLRTDPDNITTNNLDELPDC